MPDNKRMILNLYAGMQDALFLGDRFARGEFVSFMQPGQFISQSLQEADSTDDMAILSEIANVLVDSSYVNSYEDVSCSASKELPGSVANVFEDLMTAGHVALPHQSLSPDVVQEMSELQTWLATHQAAYDLYRERFFDAVEAYDFEAAKQQPAGSKLLRLRQKQDDAARDWNVFGARQLYDNKAGRYAYLSGEDPTGYWSRIGQEFAAQRRQSPHRGSYYQTFLVPAVSAWASGGWAEFERRIAESDSYSYSKSTSWAGGVSAGFGLWSIGGGASGSSRYVHERSSASTVNLKFEYLRVRISRPWLRGDILAQRFWTWSKLFGGQVLSDGGNVAVTPPVRPIGRMPVLPQYLIVVRNVELSSAFSTDERTSYEKHVKAGASVGFGPFSLSGSYAESESTKYTHASFDGVTFRIQQPQIIARSGMLLPRSPNPDLSLPWKDDAWFPLQTLLWNEDARAEDAARLLTSARDLERLEQAERLASAWWEQAHS